MQRTAAAATPRNHEPQQNRLGARVCRRCVSPVFAALLASWLTLATGAAQAQLIGDRVSPNDPQLGEAFTQKYQIGVIVSANSGPCRGIVATAPVPIAWPEQEVRVVDEDRSSLVRNLRERMVEGTVKQMLVEIPFVPAGAEVKAILTLEITRHSLLAPKDPSAFVLSDNLPRDIRVYLGPSPYIESQNYQIKKVARDILADKQDLSAWKQVEAIYDWVRQHVQYKNGPLKGALRALKDGSGDCEELTSLFIALCRANKIPARTVWVPGHCYPEFYLQDKEGVGHWLPCQAAGSREFGEISERRPILQKGDNFRVPERPRDRQRYVAEFLTGAGGKPTVRFLRKLVEDGK